MTPILSVLLKSFSWRLPITSFSQIQWLKKKTVTVSSHLVALDCVDFTFLTFSSTLPCDYTILASCSLCPVFLSAPSLLSLPFYSSKSMYSYRLGVHLCSTLPLSNPSMAFSHFYIFSLRISPTLSSQILGYIFAYECHAIILIISKPGSVDIILSL